MSGYVAAVLADSPVFYIGVHYREMLRSSTFGGGYG